MNITDNTKKKNWKRNIFFTNPENSSTYLSLFLSFINGTHKYINKYPISLKSLTVWWYTSKTPQNYMCMMEKKKTLCTFNYTGDDVYKMHDFHSFLKNADFSIYFHSLDKRKAGISYGMNVSCYIIPTEYNVTSITYGGVVYCLKFFFIKRVQYNRNNNSTIIYVGAANNFSLVNFNHLEKLGWCFYSNFPENCCIINWLLLKNRW